MDGSHSSALDLNSVHLANAVLCVECEIISNSAGDICEICGSRSLLNLGRVLGGSIEGQRAVLVHTDENHLRNMFTVLVNPEAGNVIRQRRKRKQLALFEKTGG